ncbi:MAG: hypothetical protein JWL59_913 [Chthoniobacteraceae bacterium]|nr:hypothetical protein [Chthoniobacteraceae bacterium]
MNSVVFRDHNGDNTYLGDLQVLVAVKWKIDARKTAKTVTLPRTLALNNNGDEVALIGSDGIERHRVNYTRQQVHVGEKFNFRNRRRPERSVPHNACRR